MVESERLVLLRKLKTQAAATPENDGFFEAVERGLDRRASSSGVMAFAQSLGLDGKGLKVRVTLGSTSKNPQNVPEYQGSVVIDATSARWFHVWLSRVSLMGSTSTRFTTDSATDALNVGRCEPEALPAWLAKTQETLKIRWRDAAVLLRLAAREEAPGLHRLALRPVAGVTESPRARQRDRRHARRPVASQP